MKAVRTIGKYGNNAAGVSLGVAMIILGAIIVVMTALGIAQYTQNRCRHHKSAYGIYVTQSIFCAIGSVVLVLGIIAVSYNATK